MSDKIRVIKAKKRYDMYDSFGNQLEDKEIIGTSIYVEGQVPESYIKYYPNRIFDRRKYPELYALFGKDHLPSEFELQMFEEKMHPKSKWQIIKQWFKNVLKL